MTAFFAYLFKVIVCSALFAGCYWCVLRNGRFHQWNRFYIMASVALSIIIPALTIPVSTQRIMIPATTDYIEHVVINPTQVIDVPITFEESPIRWEWFGVAVYLSVVFFLLAKKLFFFIRIFRLKKCSERMHASEADVYYTADDSAPFTFFRSVFWKKDVPFDSGEGRYMLCHELAHVRLGHSRDKTLMQLVCCFFWMNPFFVLFRRELDIVHEFAADSESLGEGNVEELSSLILCALYPNHYHDFISRFFQSPIKRRITMITKKQNKKSLMNVVRKMSILPVALVALYAFSIKPTDMPFTGITITSQSPADSVWREPWIPQNNELEEIIVIVGYGQRRNESTQNDAPPKSAPPIEIKVVRENERRIASGAISYNDVEQKPVFQDGTASYLKYLAANIKYPVIAQENGIVGKIVVSYVIDTEGKVTDVQSPVKIDLLSIELERVIKSLPAWKPGVHNGKNVAVQCYAFAEFRLQQ